MRMLDGTSKKFFGLTLDERIDLYTSPEPMSGCWLWMGGMRNGVDTPDIKYTQDGKTTSIVVRRYNHRRFIGTPLTGLRVMQTCGVAECVNPFHQSIGKYSISTEPQQFGRKAGKTIYQRIDEMIEYEPNSGCWLWSGNHHGHGYGQTAINGKNVRIHRFQYERYKGPIPEGMVVRHKCDDGERKAVRALASGVLVPFVR